MGRGSKLLNIPAGMSSMTHSRPKERVPGKTLCELCDVSMHTNSWPQHKNSKAHRAKEAEESGETTNGNGNFNGNSGGDSAFTTGNNAESSSGNTAWNSADTPSGNDGWGAAGASSGTDPWSSSNKKSSNTGGGTGGGDGDRECYGCGLTGHTKRDCPTSSGGQGCFNCGEVGFVWSYFSPSDTADMNFRHRKSECTQPRKPYGGGSGGGGGSGSDRLCFNCSLPGLVFSISSICHLLQYQFRI